MMIRPDWDAPARVKAFVTTRELGDLKTEDAKITLRVLVPAEPAWLKQVHGKRVIDLDSDAEREGDAAITRKLGTVCVAQAADCMPVLFADVDGTTVAAAHAGWRGLSAGVLEATLDAMRVPALSVCIPSDVGAPTMIPTIAATMGSTPVSTEALATAPATGRTKVPALSRK